MVEIYLTLSFILCTHFLVLFKDINIFDDDKDLENKIVKIIVIFLISILWIITLPIMIIEQRKK